MQTGREGTATSFHSILCVDTSYFLKHLPFNVHGQSSPALFPIWNCFVSFAALTQDFGINMFVLHSFGSTMVHSLGTMRFSRLFFISSICAGVAQIFYNRAFHQPYRSSLGASGITFPLIYQARHLGLWHTRPLPILRAALLY